MLWMICFEDQTGQVHGCCSLIPSSLSRCDFEMLKYSAAADKNIQIKMQSEQRVKCVCYAVSYLQVDNPVHCK